MFSLADKKKLQKAQREARIADLKELQAIASKCFEMEEFKEYKRRYVSIERKLLNNIIEMDCTDPVLYALEVSNTVTKIKTLRSLVDTIEQERNFNPEENNEKSGV